jgi:type I restriction enzyme R subunit
MSLHKEIAFEDGICAHLATDGWVFDTGAADRYDRARALFPDDLIAWVQASQPDAWASLAKSHGPAAGAQLANRLRMALDKQGTLELLRAGLDVVGLKQRVALCQFRPALAMNEALQARYDANILRVVRQVRFSPDTGQSIDLVLFLNGIPVATAELKSDYTQSVADAVDQYCYDRNPKPLGRSAEPLLSFPGGALVHFAVSNSEVRMCTNLAGTDSKFLPFNLGHDHGAGNPPNPTGAATAYLWQEVWQRHSWLDILGRYIVPVRDEKRRLAGWIFPRFHQLDATRRLVAQILADGPGGKYLIQHSAGSGKTNSIAWTAHFLADLHDAENRKLFDTVLVVSDRTILDEQLSTALMEFQRTRGVVAIITGGSAAKSAQLARALAEGKKIVVCTIQTFPHALDEVRRLASSKGKRFAVIADEAHSSQTGKAAAELKLVLTAEEQAALEDGGDIGVEDVLAAKMRSRADQDAGISYVAFTATPKAKTKELFGVRPDPTRPAASNNIPKAFHIYSMRQAIEEAFILDVLQNYISYKQAFQLTHDGRQMDEREVDASEARKRIMGWVRLHPHNIAARVEIVVEHFRQNVAHLLGGKAKAMVVTAGRKEAVRWALAMRGYIAARGYRIGTLVAFSGGVPDPDSGPEEFTEENMNPDLRGRDLAEAFDTAEFSILLVANKFQTGFDQKLLCAMYVDRSLGGIQAVQTLSRLNRAYSNNQSAKDTTYVVDFINEPAKVLEAFKQYHTTAELAGVSDPNVVLDLRNKLDATGCYDQYEVERVAKVTLKPKASQADLDAAIGPVSNRLVVRFKYSATAFKAEAEGSKAQLAAKDEMDRLLLFRGDLASYVRVYEFLSQMFDYGNTEFEKLYLFAKMLFPLLKYERERDGIDLSALKLTHHRMRDLGRQKLNLNGGGDAEPLRPMSEVGSGQVQDKHKLMLAAIIAAINDLFQSDVTDGDKVSYAEGVINKMVESPKLKAQATANTAEQFKNSPDLHPEMMRAVMGMFAANQSMTKEVLNSEAIQARLLLIALNQGALFARLRGDGDADGDVSPDVSAKRPFEGPGMAHSGVV